jgi:hypothetical protein
MVKKNPFPNILKLSRRIKPAAMPIQAGKVLDNPYLALQHLPKPVSTMRLSKTIEPDA